MARRRSSRRSKPKKRPNRYDPNNPDYQAVHGARSPGIAHMPVGPMTLLGWRLGRRRKR